MITARLKMPPFGDHLVAVHPGKQVLLWLRCRDGMHYELAFGLGPEPPKNGEYTYWLERIDEKGIIGGDA